MLDLTLLNMRVENKVLEILVLLHLLLTLKLEIITSFLNINFKVKKEII